MKRFEYLSHSLNKRQTKTDFNKTISTNDYTIQNSFQSSHYFFQNNKNQKVKIVNKKYASLLHRLLDDDICQNKIKQKSQRKNKSYNPNIKLINISPNKTKESIFIKTSLKAKTKSKSIFKKKMEYSSQNKYLQKLYGDESNYDKIKKYLDNHKNLNLKKYQDKMFKVSRNNLSKNNMIKFISILKEIRDDAEMIKPLPPINLPEIIIHSIKENEEENRNNNKAKKYSEMDDYEKEMYNIIQDNRKFKVLLRRNK